MGVNLWRRFQSWRRVRYWSKIKGVIYVDREIDPRALRAGWSLRPVIRRPVEHHPAYLDGDLVCPCGFRYPWFTREARDHAMAGFGAQHKNGTAER